MYNMDTTFAGILELGLHEISYIILSYIGIVKNISSRS